MDAQSLARVEEGSAGAKNGMGSSGVFWRRAGLLAGSGVVDGLTGVLVVVFLALLLLNRTLRFKMAENPIFCLITF